jgi:hypothetical protein
MWRYPPEVPPDVLSEVLPEALTRQLPSKASPIATGLAAPFKFAATAALVFLLATLAGCGEVRISYGDFHCPSDPPPGIVVEFVARNTGSPVAVDATGVLSDGPYVEQMSPTVARHAAAGRTYALAGAYDREGIYDVRVETAFGEVLTWSRIKVSSDRCGPFTVFLQASLGKF